MSVLTPMVVAYCINHNEGVETGIITEPGFDSELSLVDMYEVDGSIASFATLEEAEAWLTEQGKEDD